jgi:hypothetical protein
MNANPATLGGGPRFKPCRKAVERPIAKNLSPRTCLQMYRPISGADSQPSSPRTMTSAPSTASASADFLDIA